MLPPEYESNKTRFGYDVILDTYFVSLEKAKEISLEMIDKKMDFIRYSFQASKQELYKQLEALKENSDFYQELLEDCGGRQVTVNSYSYGEGESCEPADVRIWNISAHRKTLPRGIGAISFLRT